MSRTVPISRGTVPKGGLCRYRDPDAGFTVQHPYYVWCKAFALDGRRKAGLEIPWNWDEFFDEHFCKATPQACREIPEVPKEPNLRWTTLAKTFAKSMIDWAKSGFKIVDYEILKFRVAQCQGDPGDADQGIAPTPRCRYFSHFSGTTLSRCAKCGCSGIKLHLATSHCPDNPSKW